MQNRHEYMYWIHDKRLGYLSCFFSLLTPSSSSLFLLSSFASSLQSKESVSEQYGHTILALLAAAISSMDGGEGRDCGYVTERGCACVYVVA